MTLALPLRGRRFVQAPPMTRALAGSSTAHLRSAISDENYLVRWAAVSVVGSEGHRELIDDTAAALNDWHRVVRESAADALVKIGYDLAGTDREAAFWAARRSWRRCAALGEPAVEPLALLLHDDRPRLRKLAIRLLAQLGASSSQSHLEKTAVDEDISVRRAVVHALPQHRSWATQLLANRLSDESPSVRRAACRALDEQGWQPPSADARVAAAYWAVKGRFDLCARFGTDGVAPLLLELLSGPNADAAADALANLGQSAGLLAKRGDYWTRTAGDRCLPFRT